MDLKIIVEYNQLVLVYRSIQIFLEPFAVRVGGTTIAQADSECLFCLTNIRHKIVIISLS